MYDHLHFGAPLFARHNFDFNAMKFNLNIYCRRVNSYVIGDSVLYRTKASCTKIRPLEVLYHFYT